jgi:CDP-6-deoxy-D-xylo-4-hexulose-3-dehydrase
MYKLSNDTWGKEEIEAIKRVVNSNMYSMGKEVRNFELEFAKKVGSKYAVMSNSGSSANLLAIASLVYSDMLERGDEVIVTAVSWSTTYFPLQQFNLKVKFVDIDRDTLNIDVSQIEDAISDKTRAIFAVNLLGNPNYYSMLLEICKKHDLILIEDNCESMGGTYGDRQLGTFGLLGTFSCFYSHHISTMEGGITVTDNEELYSYLLSLRAHGWTRGLPDDSCIYKKSTDKFYESFNFIVPGFNLRPIEMEGAIGLEQLKKLPSFITQRRENAKYFIERTKEIEWIRTQKEIGMSSWYGFAIITENNNRDKIVECLNENEIEVRPIMAGNFTRNSVINFFDYTVHGELTNADDVHNNGFFVGNHSNNIEDKIEKLVELLKKIK